MKSVTRVRVCPRCNNEHRTTVKSNKAICSGCKKTAERETKAYKYRIARQKRRKLDKEWSVKAREKPCLVCGSKDFLNAHHIIPREISEYRHEPLNAVSLCAKHHKFSYEVSAHKHPAMFFYILQKKSPQQYKWVMDKMKQDYLKGDYL